MESNEVKVEGGRWIAGMIAATVLAGAVLTFGTVKFPGPIYLLGTDYYRWDPNGRIEVNDVDVNDPNLIYGLDHDSFAGFVADEHLPSAGTVSNGDTTHVVTGDAVYDFAAGGGASGDPNVVLMSFNINTPAGGHDNVKKPFIRAVTITKVIMKCDGGTNVVGRLYEVDGDGDPSDQVGVENSDWTVTTAETEDTTFANASIDAGDYISWDTTSVSGSVGNFHCTVIGYE